MDATEFRRWAEYMKTRRGQWTLDAIHNGQNGARLLAFCPDAADQTTGVWVELALDGACSGGTYEGAIPHIGEACFRTIWSAPLGDFGAARLRILERLGLG